MAGSKASTVEKFAQSWDGVVDQNVDKDDLIDTGNERVTRRVGYIEKRKIWQAGKQKILNNLFCRNINIRFI